MCSATTSSMSPSTSDRALSASEPLDKADELESGRAGPSGRAGACGDVADDAQDRHPSGHVSDDAADDLAGEGLADRGSPLRS